MSFEEMEVFRHDRPEKVLGLTEDDRIVDENLIHVGAEVIPDRSDDEIRFLINQFWCFGRIGEIDDFCMNAIEILEVAMQLIDTLTDPGCPDDIPGVVRDLN